MKPPESIEILIQTIRGHKVMSDADLAALYGVPTRALNQAIKRNSDRFPEDFIFRLAKKEKSEVVTNCDLKLEWPMLPAPHRVEIGFV